MLDLPHWCVRTRTSYVSTGELFPGSEYGGSKIQARDEIEVCGTRGPCPHKGGAPCHWQEELLT
jgi:hypothetical protein